MTETGHLLAQRVVTPPRPMRPLGRWFRGRFRADPVLLEIFNNLFMSIAEQMGFRLTTAQSVNIREAAGLLRAVRSDGNLVANARTFRCTSLDGHRQVRRRLSGMKPGDVYAVNDRTAALTCRTSQ